MNRIKAAFFYSTAFVLIATALAKLYSATGDVKLLHTPDSLLQINYGILLPLAAALELAVAAVLIVSKSDKVKSLSLLWLSLNFMFYRLGFWWIGLPMEHCKCLGNLSDTLHLNPKMVQSLLQGMIFYFSLGSLITLLCSILKERMAGGASDSPIGLDPTPGANL